MSINPIPPEGIMVLNRFILSLESLGERIVPDAAPAIGPVPELLVASTSNSIPPNPDPLPVPPAPPAVVATLPELEQVLRSMALQIQQCEALFREAQRAMFNAAREGNTAMLSYWARVALEYHQLQQEVIVNYNKIRDAYEDEANRVGHTIPPDIIRFDPDNIIDVPALPPSPGGTYT